MISQFAHCQTKSRNDWNLSAATLDDWVEAWFVATYGASEAERLPALARAVEMCHYNPARSARNSMCFDDVCASRMHP